MVPLAILCDVRNFNEQFALTHNHKNAGSPRALSWAAFHRVRQLSILPPPNLKEQNPGLSIFDHGHGHCRLPDASGHRENRAMQIGASHFPQHYFFATADSISKIRIFFIAANFPSDSL
jgi:hypothetical protein